MLGSETGPVSIFVMLTNSLLLEKPMGQSEEQCQDIVNVSAETGKMVTVCYILRYHPYFMKLKELSADCAIEKECPYSPVDSYLRRKSHKVL